jgi:succinyl-CoA synthetase beta subunit
MNIHEYQAKALLRRYNVPVLVGGVAFTPHEACDVARNLGGNVWVIKAQIHAGGRGKAGGVKVVRSIEEVQAAAQSLLGHALITPQTSKEGQVVRRVYIEQGCQIAHEYYLSFLIDRSRNRILLMASAAGGMDIETVAVTAPEKIIQIAVHPATGVQQFHARELAYKLGFSGDLVGKFCKLVVNMAKAFEDLDVSMIEINPLVKTTDNQLYVLDTKMTFDNNALFRHADIEELYDPDEEDPMEREAKKHDLNYIKLNGNIGCMVNGAGLAMATMDLIKLYGGEPANFLDIGGGATKERITAAFKIILSDPQVKGVLVNIFGGIMRCDLIAEGIIAAAQEIAFQVPVVVRLQGTNVGQGRMILEQSGLKIIGVDGFADAAQAIVKQIQGA